VTGREPGELAAAALVSVAVGNSAAAAQAVRALAGTGALTSAMYRWVDTLVELSRQHGSPVPGAPPAGPGQDRDQDGALWAGQFLAARAVLDASACARLISAVPDGRSEEYALMLLGAVSGRISRIPVADREPWE